MSTSRSTTFAAGHDMAGPHGSSGAAAAGVAGHVVRSTIGFVTQALDWIGEAMERSRQRNDLARLDDRLLKDIGLTRYDALVEFHKPFWR